MKNREAMSDEHECFICHAPAVRLSDGRWSALCARRACDETMGHQVASGTASMARMRALQLRAQAGKLVMPFDRETIRARVRPL